MLALIRKDLLLHKMAFLGFAPMLVFFLGWLAFQVHAPNVFVVFACIYAALLPMVFIAREDKFGADTFVCSLPVTRKQIARAKFVLSWVVALIFTAVGLAIYSIVAPSDAPAIWTMSSVGRALVGLTLLLGVLLPFLLRFGWTGMILGLVGAQILGIIALLIAQFFRDQVRPGDLFRSVSSFLGDMREQLGDPLYLAAAVFVLAVVNWISYKVTLVLYERREL